MEQQLALLILGDLDPYPPELTRRASPPPEVRRAGKPRYRLVYRYTPNEVEAVAVEAVAVGERSGLDVYLTAAERLGRQPEA